jgi:hypothetical protein
MENIQIAAVIGWLIGALILTGVISRLYRWLARGIGDRLVRALVPNFICLLTCASIFGFSGLGGDYMHSWLLGLIMYGIPQLIWLMTDLRSPAKAKAVSKTQSER